MIMSELNESDINVVSLFSRYERIQKIFIPTLFKKLDGDIVNASVHPPIMLSLPKSQGRI